MLSFSAKSTSLPQTASISRAAACTSVRSFSLSFCRCITASLAMEAISFGARQLRKLTSMSVPMSRISSSSGYCCRSSRRVSTV